ncbi:DUF5071 domain-containing protein [Paenibacillus polysaccharolyticus]|uniref:DUF5071 domain-containing protein n=1 Tax=Paenibacillus sp. FSL R7-0272 TaxID=2921679 RepID=UPI0030084144
MNIRTILPKDKFDVESVEKLAKRSNDELRHILPELMEWLQDGNWPISKPVEDLLLRFGDELYSICISNKRLYLGVFYADWANLSITFRMSTYVKT